MSKSEIRRKHAADAMQLHRRSYPASHPYKEGPPVRGNGASMQDALEDKDKIPRINHLAKDQLERLTGGVGRPLGSARGRPNLACNAPRCISRRSHGQGTLSPSIYALAGNRPPSSINRASLTPLNTYTHFIPFSPRRLSSLLLS